MGIGRKPMCKAHPRQYAHSCVNCDLAFRRKVTGREQEPVKEDNNDRENTNDTAVAEESK